ncbi:glutamate racemase [Alkaliphilus pronyensis]|uniref:Glutamate racemase n=1 Tax=Alkaliphilus pronyensis TaxID=1482732 RepID=A0A6I0FC17_9FIRM|nr:glutamate racemase [Alkaliphilus pronyensis]KAB3535300.1 glutamate racemase [Alkaliphilus pronyensis]
MKEVELLPIGVFDSGVGGISALAQLIAIIPNEKYIYYGDSKNAPYGTKATTEVMVRSLEVADILIKKGIKLLVVACNTATSAAIVPLREKLDIPVIGMEPALKPAVKLNNHKKIVVMATPVTLKEKKFSNLILQFENEADIIKLPAPGLVEIIEKHGSKSKDLEAYLKRLFYGLDLSKVSTIVLGCTHYVFIKDTIRNVVGNNVDLIDGNYGTAIHVKSLLSGKENNQVDEHTSVQIMSSSTSKAMVNLSKRLLEEELHKLNHKGSIKYV